MAKITKNLQISFDNDSYLQSYTREKDILSASVKAPTINYAPADYVATHSSMSNIRDVFSIRGNVIHYDFSKLVYGQGQTWYILDCSNATEFEVGESYTFSFRVHNLEGTANMSTSTYLKPWCINAAGIANSARYSSFQVKNGFYFFTFEMPSVFSTITWAPGTSWINPFDARFDLEIIGLTKGKYPLTKSSESFSSPVGIGMTNVGNRVGEYSLSRKVTHHLRQLERKISRNTGIRKIDWR